MKTRPLVRFVIAIVFFLALNGIAIDDYSPLLTATEHPTKLAVGSDFQFLYSSPFHIWLGALLRRLLGFKVAFVLMVATEMVALTAILYAYLRRRFGERAFDAASIAFLSCPVLFVVSHYLGKSDAALVACYVALLLSARPFAIVLLSAALIVTHREIGTAVLLSHLVLRRASPSFAWIAAGLLAGHAAIWTYHHAVLDAVPVGRLQFLLSHRDEILLPIFSAPASYLLWTFGLFWFAIVLLEQVRAREIMVFVAALSMALLALDFTRVFALVSLPLVLSLIERLTGAHADDEAEPIWTRLTSRHPIRFLILVCLVQFQVHLGGQVSGSNVPPQLWKRFGSAIVSR